MNLGRFQNRSKTEVAKSTKETPKTSNAAVAGAAEMEGGGRSRILKSRPPGATGLS